MGNPYIPMPVRLKAVKIENEAKDLKTFDFVFENPDHAEAFKFICGQFAMLSINGTGEAPFGIASSPLDRDVVQFTVKRYPKGALTTALYNVSVGDMLGLRGPFGNGYPMKELEGKNLVIVGGGFAMTTLRATMKYALHQSSRAKFGEITLLVAAREPGEILYKDDIAAWSARDDVEVVQAIDTPYQGWTGRVGFAAAVLNELSPSSDSAYALVCGPPIMIKTCVGVLRDLGFPPERILLSLERKMKCGIGICGRCNIGNKYVCKDGPVFTYKQILSLSNEY